MALRSLLFVPGDRPDRMAKALDLGADALILDLEDAVAPAAKPEARQAIAAFLAEHPGPRACKLFVRVNPLDGTETAADLDALKGAAPDGIVLPKAEGAASICTLLSMMAERGLAAPILPIACETPGALFQLGSYGEVAGHLAGVTWGAEDLPVSIGAAGAREADGRYTPVFETVRALVLFAGHAAGVGAVETVFPAFRDVDSFAGYLARARRDGFTGMMAIHPTQVPLINAAFSPTPAEVEAARRIIDAFATNPGAGVLQIDGKMVDMPHLKAARTVIERHEAAG
jgi:citrate lyase subunit beta/citryl-CoA lyase